MARTVRGNARPRAASVNMGAEQHGVETLQTAPKYIYFHLTAMPHGEKYSQT